MTGKKKRECEIQEDRSRALLALSAREPVEEGSCPSIDELAAFMDGTLEPAEREAVLAHLDACPKCYNDWLAVSSMRDETLWRRLCSRLEGVISEGRKLLLGSGRRYLAPAFAVAAVACLALFFWLPGLRAPDLSGLIGKSYTTALLESISFEQAGLGEDPSLPWERPTRSYGFSSPKQYLHASRAFGAGLWAGRQALLKGTELPPMPDFLSPGWQDENAVKEGWSETPWAAYYWMGKWSFFLRTVCLSGKDVSYKFWQRQAVIAERLQKDFLASPERTEEDTRIVTAGLDHVKFLLNTLGQGGLREKQGQVVAAELDFVIEHLSPTLVPREQKEENP